MSANTMSDVDHALGMALHAHRTATTDLELAVLRYITVSGCTATELARRLDITRQAANQRWGHIIRARDKDTR